MSDLSNLSVESDGLTPNSVLNHQTPDSINAGIATIHNMRHPSLRRLRERESGRVQILRRLEQRPAKSALRVTDAIGIPGALVGLK